MRPDDNPEGWRRAYFEASAVQPRRGPGDSACRFLLAFLPTFAAGHQLAALILERML